MTTWFIPTPEQLSFTEWGSLVAEQLAAFGVSAPASEDGWRTWVAALFFVPELESLNIPSADGFDTWQLWAQQFIGSVR